MFDVPNIPPSMALCEIVSEGKTTSAHCEIEFVTIDNISVVEFKTENVSIVLSGPPYENGFDLLFSRMNDGESVAAAGRCDILKYTRKISCRMNVGHQVYLKAQW